MGDGGGGCPALPLPVNPLPLGLSFSFCSTMRAAWITSGLLDGLAPASGQKDGPTGVGDPGQAPGGHLGNGGLQPQASY